MDENKNYDDYHYRRDDCWLYRHPVLKHILAALMVFLGAYLAFYTVADWHFKRMVDPVVQMRRIEKDMMNKHNQMAKMLKRDFEREERFFEQEKSYIHVEKKNDAYEIIVNLKPFDNDEKNVEVSTDGDTLTVSAAGISDTKRQGRMIKVMQQYGFDEDVDFEKIKKERKGSDYIITVPFKK